VTAQPADGLSARERSPFGQFELRRSHLRTGPSPYPPGDPRRIRATVAHLQRATLVGSATSPADQHRAALTVAEAGLRAGAPIADVAAALEVLGLLEPVEVTP
jgi:hypothetical protein